MMRLQQVILALFILSAVEAFSNPVDLSGDDIEANEMEFSQVDGLATCTKATKQQISVINQGNTKRVKFLEECAKANDNSAWCLQLIRPNPNSIGIFQCTYGSDQVHQLIHPDESTWKHAFNSIGLIVDLQKKGIAVCSIYNWWRPEPYNQNVGGAAGRHPFATSVDVAFCTQSDAIRGFDELCKARKKGLVKALGYYGNTGVHFGVGDKTGNTWGRNCN